MSGGNVQEVEELSELKRGHSLQTGPELFLYFKNVDNGISVYKRIKFDPSSFHIQKWNQNVLNVIDLTERAKAIKLLEENTGKNTCDTKQSKGFLGMKPKYK